VDPGDQPRNLTYVCRLFPEEGGGDFTVNPLVFSPNEKRLATLVTQAGVTPAKSSYEVRIVSTEGGAEMRKLTFPIKDDDIGAAAWSPDGTHLALACQGSIVMINAKSGTVDWKIAAHKKKIDSLAFSLDGKKLASGGEEPLASCWEVASGRRLATHKSHVTAVVGVGFDPSGNRVFSCSSDGELDAWESGTGKSAWKVYGPAGACGLAVSAELQEILVGNSADSIASYQISNGQGIASTRLIPAWKANTAMDFSADSRFAVRYVLNGSVGKYSVGIVDTDSGKSMAELDRETPTDKGVISRTGRLLAVQDSGGGVTVWRRTEPD
jgi:WD40 repeat protein